MRSGAAVLAVAVVLATAAPLHADEWTLIEVTTRLANDARTTVVETHHIVLDSTGRNTFRTFGLGADQAIRLTALTRIGPDAEPHALKAVETVAGPDEYRYYDRGHVYYSIPPLGEHIAVQYRFEYELVGAIAPAWAIAAGPGSRASGEQEFFWPWERVAHIVADWRRAWPALATRYRFDHDVLLPDADGGQVFRQIDYRLEYGTAWRDIAPRTDVGEATHGAYRAARIFDYLGSGIPPHATTPPAALRLTSLLVPPIAGVLGWLLVVAWGRVRRQPAIDRTFVETRVLPHAPEEIGFWLTGSRPAMRDVLARLAGEAAIGIRATPPDRDTVDAADDVVPVHLHMRRVAPAAGLTSFERDVLEDVFGDAQELTTESHRQRHAGRDYDPQVVIERRLLGTDGVAHGAAAGPPDTAGGRWSPARVGVMAIFLGGIASVFWFIGPLVDVVPILAMWAVATVALVNAWPTGWWYPGRAVSGLLIALVLLVAMQLALLLIPNRPLPAEGWAASALAVVAGYFLTLVRSRVPSRGGTVVADLLRMRAYAQAELQRSRPQLDDRWIARLRALGLGRAIEAWRARHTGGATMPPDHGDRPVITSAHFTGLAPAAWVGPTGWDRALRIYDDSEYEDEEDDEDDEDDDPPS